MGGDGHYGSLEVGKVCAESHPTGGSSRLVTLKRRPGKVSRKEYFIRVGGPVGNWRGGGGGGPFTSHCALLIVLCPL